MSIAYAANLHEAFMQLGRREICVITMVSSVPEKEAHQPAARMSGIFMLEVPASTRRARPGRQDRKGSLLESLGASHLGCDSMRSLAH